MRMIPLKLHKRESVREVDKVSKRKRERKL